MRRAHSTVLPLALLALGLVALCRCGSSGDSTPDDDSGTDTGTDGDADTDTDEEDAAVDGGDTDTSPSGQLGEPCWNDHYPADHPNSGLPDCVQGLSCIGNDEGAWCTQTCIVTGDIESGGPLDGWCCGEMSNPCDPQRFWLPAPMSAACIPRSAGLAESCENGTSWPSTALRCAPRCDDTTLVSETMCVQYGGETFCSFVCEPSGTPCGFLEPVFESGCCESYMGADWCTPEELCP